MTIVLYLVSTLLALGILVTVHEWGHFWVARRLGVRVIRFSVGLGWPIKCWRDRWGTEYALSALPLGGYVRMLAQEEASAAELAQQQALQQKTIGARIAILLAGPVANLLFALLIYWLLLMIGEHSVKPIVGQSLPGLVAQQSGLKAGDQIVAVDGQTTLNWEQINTALIKRLGDSGQIELQTADNRRLLLPIDHWLRDTAQPDVLAALGIVPWRPSLPAVIGELVADGPAQRAQLQSGDRIVMAAEQPIRQWQDWVDQVRASANQPLVLQVERMGQQLSLTVVPETKIDQSGQSIGYVGAAPQPWVWPEDQLIWLQYDPLTALQQALSKVWDTVQMILGVLAKMLVGWVSLDNLGGPLSIAQAAGTSAGYGWAAFASFLAFLSISLAVINLLPVPILDGGQIVLTALEGVRGRALSPQWQGWLMQLGLVMIVSVMLLAVFNDIERLYQ